MSSHHSRSRAALTALWGGVGGFLLQTDASIKAQLMGF